MKVLVPLLLAAVVCAGCATRAKPKGSHAWRGFPVLPAIADADPTVRNEMVVMVPTRLKIERTADTLSVMVDPDSLERISIGVGSKMLTGVWHELFVYPEGDTQPSETGKSGLSGGLDFDLGTRILNANLDGIPVPGKKYVVAMVLALFETDIPPQHMWSPQSKNYLILWRRTLRQTVE